MKKLTKKEFQTCRIVRNALQIQKGINRKGTPKSQILSTEQKIPRTHFPPENPLNFLRPQTAMSEASQISAYENPLNSVGAGR